MKTTWTVLEEIVRAYPGGLSSASISNQVAPKVIRESLKKYDFGKPLPLDLLTQEVSDLFSKWSLHVSHPGYLGLFIPATTEASVVADALVALYNPQLAVWSHAPAANEIESHVLKYISEKIGYPQPETFSNFTSGGSEANHTALLVALAKQVPAYVNEGVGYLERRPMVYMSVAGHNSFDKIVKNIGLGLKSLRKIETDDTWRINLATLESQIESDISAGFRPAVIIGTAGTTASGAIDSLPELAALAKKYNMWFHVDAAWAGAAVLSRALRHHLSGIELSDSVTIDAHKWFSVAMGAGMFFTRHPEAVQVAFGIPAVYMPSQAQTEPYATTLQWSRRCIGLKLFMTLAEKGEEALIVQMEYQCKLTGHLRDRLTASGWKIVNDSPVGVLNFTHPQVLSGLISADDLRDRLELGGEFWLSTVPLPRHGKVLRACVTSFHTTEEHLDRVVEQLNDQLNNYSL